MKHLLPFLIAFVLLSNSACTAKSQDPTVDVLDLTAQAAILTFPQTVSGLKDVVNDAPNTFRLLEPSGNYLLGWSQGKQWAIVELSPDGFFARNLGDMYRANRIDSLNLTSVLNSSEGEFVSAKDLPAMALSALDGLFQWAVSAMMDVIPVIIVLPPLDGEYNIIGNG
jgi:hypothetical protein